MNPAVIAAIALSLSAAAVAAEVLSPATRPATQPTLEMRQRVSQLIGQLGDPQHRLREAATDELRKLGPAISPQLKEATGNPDAEIAARARTILDEFEAASKPKPPAAEEQPRLNRIRAGGIMIRGGFAGGQFKRQAQTTEDGRTIKVTEDNQSIAVTITQQKDGKEVTEEFKAATAEELKKNHPEAHKYYEKLLGPRPAGRAVQIRIGGQ